MLASSIENLRSSYIRFATKDRYQEPDQRPGQMNRYGQYLYHYLRAGENNLTREQNDWVLLSLWARLTETEQEGLPLPPVI